MRRGLTVASLVVLICCATSALAQPAVGWWKPQWQRRVGLTIPSPGAVVSGAPVILPGRVILDAAGGESVAVGSLRVVGPQGEVPCQLDEYDGTGGPVTAPNHELDPDDELSFQADLPAQGAARYWLYWSPNPMPPGKYTVTCRVHEAVEPGPFTSDVQMHNRAVLMGMKGPATGEDPTKNESANHGNGLITFLDFYHHRIISGGWGSNFPQGAFFGGPSSESKKWSAPRQICWGPVRCGASVTMAEGNVTVAPNQTARLKLEHRAFLFDRGAWVLFEEIFTPLEPIAKLSTGFACGFSLNPNGTDRFWYTEKGQPKFYQPDPALIAEGAAGKVIWGGADSWVSKYTPTDKMLYTAVLNEGEPLPGETRQPTSYGRNHVTLRLTDTYTNLAQGQAVTRRFWYVAVPGEHADGTLGNAIPLALSPRAVQVGALEKGGGRG